MKWSGNPFSPGNPNKPKEAMKLEKYCDLLRPGITDKHNNPLVLRDAIIRIMIIRHGPCDREEIHRILTGLHLLKEESTDVEDAQFYLCARSKRTNGFTSGSSNVLIYNPE